jgi:predicted PurR-regulated permease PerM
MNPTIDPEIGQEPSSPPAGEPASQRMPPLHVGTVLLGTVAFLYFARPVVLPIFVAWMAAMALRPVVRWLSVLHFPAALSAAIVFCLLVACVGFGFVQLERPAARWMNEAPKHMAELRQRVRRIFPSVAHFSQAATAVSDLGATEKEKKEEERETPMVEVKDQGGTATILNWTGTLMAGLGEVLVLIYLLLASGDLFLQKLVRVMPTLRGKIRALEISHEVQQNISNYLFSASLINLTLGALVSLGLFLLGVPNPAMWGVLAAFLNFHPLFRPGRRGHPPGRRGHPDLRLAGAGPPAAPVVPCAPPPGGESRHPDPAGQAPSRSIPWPSSSR